MAADFATVSYLIFTAIIPISLLIIGYLIFREDYKKAGIALIIASVLQLAILAAIFYTIFLPVLRAPGA